MTKCERESVRVERGSRHRGRWTRRVFVAVLAGGCLLLASNTAHAWLLVEHTSIGRRAAADLDTNRRGVLEQAWLSLIAAGNLGSAHVYLRVAAPDTPVESPPSPNESSFETSVDLPMMAALAGDHSCDQQDLAATLRSDWVNELILTLRDNYEAIRRSTSPTARVSLWHKSHLDAQRIDAAYLSRAQQNGAHFVLLRSATAGVAESKEHYFTRVSQMGAPTNAPGIYITYHARALRAGALAQCAPAGPCAHPDSARDALLFEAIALHFLEDAFSGGQCIRGPRNRMVFHLRARPRADRSAHWAHPAGSHAVLGHPWRFRAVRIAGMGRLEVVLQSAGR